MCIDVRGSRLSFRIHRKLSTSAFFHLTNRPFVIGPQMSHVDGYPVGKGKNPKSEDKTVKPPSLLIKCSSFTLTSSKLSTLEPLRPMLRVL